METDGIECMHRECQYRDESFCFSCGLGGNEAAIDECWDRVVEGDPAVWVMQAIRTQVRYARKHFPHNKHLYGALGEEVGELAKAMLQGKSQHEIQREAVQVAAVAIRIIEELDADYDGWTAEDGKPKGDKH